MWSYFCDRSHILNCGGGQKTVALFPQFLKRRPKKSAASFKRPFTGDSPRKRPGKPQKAPGRNRRRSRPKNDRPHQQTAGVPKPKRPGKLPQGAEETDAPLRTHPEAPNGRRRRKPQKKIPKAAGTLNKAKPGTQAPQVPPPQDTAHPSPAPRTRNTTHRQRMLQTTEWSARPHMPRDDPAFTHKFRLGKIIETLN